MHESDPYVVIKVVHPPTGNLKMNVAVLVGLAYLQLQRLEGKQKKTLFLNLKSCSHTSPPNLHFKHVF